MNLRIKSFLILMPLICGTSYADTNLDKAVMAACIVEASQSAPADKTIGEIKQECQKPVTSPVKKRRLLEKQSSINPFTIIPHKPNYILPFTYGKARHEPYGETFEGETLENFETKFQISLKYIIKEDFIFNDMQLMTGFTATSWWQAFNVDMSAAFRETNYEPEIILNYSNPWQLFGFTVDNSSISFNHQSNGRAGRLSRSWNRVITDFTVVDDNLIWNLRTWWRIPEDQKENINDSEGDDNPNIERYLGYGELGLLWKVNDEHNIDLLLRNNLRSDNKGALQIGWSFPLSTHLRGYVEYFNGYGESLIYFDQHVSRIGIGVKLTDWL